jgi:hypothetical protein
MHSVLRVVQVSNKLLASRDATAMDALSAPVAAGAEGMETDAAPAAHGSKDEEVKDQPGDSDAAGVMDVDGVPGNGVFVLACGFAQLVN